MGLGGRPCSSQTSLAVQHASFGPALYHFIHGRKEPLNESTIWSDSDGQRALDRCARGNLHEVKSKSTSGELLNALLMSNALDYVTAAILMDTAVERGGQDHELIIDTIQFTNQCARMGDDCEGNVEIWDVRSLRYANLTSLRQVSMVREVRTLKARLTDDVRPSERERIQALRAVSRGRASFASPPIFRWLNGSVCTLSPSWYQCVACAGSKTEDACRFACSDGRPGKDPSQRYQFIPNATGMYGGNFPAVEDKGFLAKFLSSRSRPTCWVSSPPMGMGLGPGPWIGAARHAAQRDDLSCTSSTMIKSPRDSGILKDCNLEYVCSPESGGRRCIAPVRATGKAEGRATQDQSMRWTGTFAHRPGPRVPRSSIRSTDRRTACAWRGAETGDMR